MASQKIYPHSKFLEAVNATLFGKRENGQKRKTQSAHGYRLEMWPQTRGIRSKGYPEAGRDKEQILP